MAIWVKAGKRNRLPAIFTAILCAQRMKNAYAQAKEKAKRRVPSGEESPEAYAMDRVSDAESAAAYECVHYFDRQGGRGIDATKENLAKLKARFQRKRLIDPLKKKGRREAAPPPVEVNGNIRRGNGIQRAANPIRRPADTLKKAVPAPHGEQGPGRIVKHTGKTVKQSVRFTGQAVTKTSGRAVKTAQSSVRTTEAMGKTAAKTSYQAMRTTQRMAQTAAATAKKTAETSMTAVRTIITGTRALIAAIVAMGWVAVVLLVVICLIGLIVSSPFGIFFSGEDSGAGQTMSMVVREINQDYEGKLEEIRTTNAHDVLEMSGSRAVWPETLAVYAVKTSTDPDIPQEVATIEGNSGDMCREAHYPVGYYEIYGYGTPAY